MTAPVGLVVAVAVLASATALGWWLRRRDGRVRLLAATRDPVDGVPTMLTATAGESADQPRLLAELGVAAGTPATLLQFSSAFCAPCRATRATCARLAAEVEGLRHVEVDAESQLSAVRALGVWRTPTVFVVDKAGRLVARVTGQPTRTQLAEAIAPLVGAGEAESADYRPTPPGAFS